jgi:hypothetical protein
MPKSKAVGLVDGDWADNEDMQPPKKKVKHGSSKRTKSISKPMSKQEAQTFLDSHFDFISSNHQKGLKLVAIAEMLC